jgi:MFS family permease
MRRYLGGVAWSAGARLATLPFVITLMRRELGLSEAQVLVTTVATFAGGLVSLYLWGRAVDRVGAAPIFRVCALGMGALVAAIALLDRDAAATQPALVAFFFLHSLLASGFGVADTRVLFELAPEHAPSRALVLASVSVGAIAGLTPALAGVALEAALGSASDGLAVYRGFFLLLGLLQALAFLPLRGFGRTG